MADAPSAAQVLERLGHSITPQRCRDLLVELVKIPSPQTELLEAEPLLHSFIRQAMEPRLRAMGFADIRYDPMGNLYSECGSGASGRRLMLITNAMNQPQNTMTNAYAGDVADGAQFGLPGEVVLGKGASEQKATIAAMLLAMEAVLASGRPITGKLVHLCCLSGETGKHDAIISVVEAMKVKADYAFLGGTSLQLSLGNRGRQDVFIKVAGQSAHSSGPANGCNAITGAIEIINRLTALPLPRQDPDLGPQTLTITHLRSFPDSTHTIQDLCELTVDRRLLPGDDPDAVFEEIKRAAMTVDGMADPKSGKPFKVDVRKGPFMYPSRVEPGADVVKLLSQACEKVMGHPPATHYSQSAFDQGYLNHIGIPTVNWGPGEYDFAHTDQDLACVDRVRSAALVYAAMLLDYLT